MPSTVTLNNTDFPKRPSDRVGLVADSIGTTQQHLCANVGDSGPQLFEALKSILESKKILFPFEKTSMYRNLCRRY